MVALPLLLCAMTAAAAPSGAAAAESLFLKALSKRDGTEKERRAAFDALRKQSPAPSKKALAEISRSWEKAGRELQERAAPRDISREAQQLLPGLSRTGARVAALVQADKVAREELDSALAEATRPLSELRVKLSKDASFGAARARLLELGEYAAWAGAIRGFTPSFGEALAELAFMRNFVAPKHLPVLEFNFSMGGFIDPREAECIAHTNVHRIRLGLRPLEIDLRLVSAARKHSEEMERLGYFSHDSPTEKLKTPWMRAARDGVAAGAENIAKGGSAAEAFDSWLYSAGHHKNMIGEGHAAIGIGVCGGTWTQLMGGGTLWQLHARMKEIAYVKARYEAGGDVEKLLKLAQWCMGQRLLTQAEDELERILVLKPEHPGARTALEKLRSMLPR